VFAGTRPLDLANVVFGLPPLLLAALATGVPALDTRIRRHVATWFAVAIVPWVAGLLLIHPAQGFVRDTDDVAAFVALLGLAAGLVLATRLARHGRATLAVPAIATAWIAAVLWIAVPAHPAGGFARVRAFVTEPPRRSPDELAASWEFLGMHAVGETRWSDAAEALGHAVELAPAPGTMRELALAEIQLGRPERAIELYRTLLARDPRNVMAWYSLAAVSTQVGDYRSAARALRSLLLVAPDNAAARENLRLIEEAHPETRDAR
jgi:tetratricopeptide (TPR) repeat protein